MKRIISVITLTAVLIGIMISGPVSAISAPAGSLWSRKH